MKILDEITELDKKVNPDNLIYRYKGKTPDVKFNKLDNAVDLTDNIREGKKTIVDVKNDQIKFKSDLSELRKETTTKKINGAKNRFVQH